MNDCFRKVRKLFLCLAGFVWWMLPMQGQDAAIYARKAANELAQGALVVRVFTNAGKLRQLRSLLQSPEISRSTRMKLEKQLADTEQENDRYWKDITTSFAENYSFSKVYFMPDSLYREFAEGRENVFWNERRQIDPDIKVQRDSYFLMITGDNTDQLILVTKDLVRLDKPFPHRIVTFLPSFKRIFNRKSYFDSQIKGFDSKLHNLKS
ncbi:MAG: hypothetical protein IPM26_04125 [Saprospiraceae bacterium]|nr:hypothetical protein [Saprospiraceae bacterium]